MPTTETETTVTVDQTDAAQDETSAGLPDAAKEVIRKEREARRDEAKRRKDAESRLATLEQQATDAADAKRIADEEAAARRGEFEALATDRKAKLDAVTAEHKAMADRVTAYEDRDRQRIDAGLADIPDNLKAFDPGKDAALDARLAWFETAQAQVAALAGTVQIVRTPGSPRPIATDKSGVAAELVRQRAAGVGRI
ncbi:MAG: hypothetical protein ACR2OO_04010 [Thermomicrobiales bacterium]